MKVNLELSDIWKGLIDPAKVEKKYNVKFVCETPLRYKEGWRDESSLIFYSQEKHPQGSNYMALSIKRDWEGNFVDLVITDGISATDNTDTGIVGLIDGDEIYYSRYRHDCRFTPSGYMIDGGRSYVRSSVCDPNQYVIMNIVKDKIEVIK